MDYSSQGYKELDVIEQLNTCFLAYFLSHIVPIRGWPSMNQEVGSHWTLNLLTP